MTWSSGPGAPPPPAPGHENITVISLALSCPSCVTCQDFAGGYLLSRDLNGTVELTTHTFWESPAAVRAFAGDDITASMVEPEAQSVLLDFDPTATHRSVLVDARG